MNGKNFDVFNSQDLMEMQLPPIKYIVERILSEGLSLLVGSSKIGKSFLVLNLCLAVARGDNFLGYPTKRGKALYLALEDNKQRLQSRLMDMTDEGSENLYFSLNASKITEGLIDEMQNFINEHPDTQLIVIDTFKYIRDSKGGSANMYDKDYEDLIPLHKFALENNVSVLLVHHERKGKTKDPFAAASGSNGLGGAVDNYLYMSKPERLENDAFLYCSGRDIVDSEFRMQLNDKKIWQVIDGEKFSGIETDNIVKYVALYVYFYSENSLLFCENESLNITATELADKINECFNLETEEKLKPNMITKNLTRYHTQLENLGITFKNNRTKSQRFLSFKMIEGAKRRLRFKYMELPQKFYSEENKKILSDDNGDGYNGDGYNGDGYIGDRYVGDRYVGDGDSDDGQCI